MTHPTPLNVPAQISVEQLNEMINKGAQFVLLDVREDNELEICRIPGSIHIPLGQLAERKNELPKDKHIVIHCHHGGRSGKACQVLGKEGYAVTNLAGGIHEWAMKIDTGMEKY